MNIFIVSYNQIFKYYHTESIWVLSDSSSDAQTDKITNIGTRIISGKTNKCFFLMPKSDILLKLEK